MLVIIEAPAVPLLGALWSLVDVMWVVLKGQVRGDSIDPERDERFEPRIFFRRSRASPMGSNTCVVHTWAQK